MCKCVLERERGREREVVTVRHIKYFMSCWTREEREPRKVGSTYLTNSG